MCKASVSASAMNHFCRVADESITPIIKSLAIMSIDLQEFSINIWSLSDSKFVLSDDAGDIFF
jgi:hypothetical protein